MTAAPVSVIRRGREKARVAPWRGHGSVALITTLAEGPLLSVEFVQHCLEVLAGRGFSRVVTAALSPLEQAGFLAAGFDVQEELRLLGLDLASVPTVVPPGVRLVGVRRRRRAQVLRVDASAFSEFWRFDNLALDDALRATPYVRFRAAAPRFGPVQGYAICGRAGRRGYVQRLAVDPQAQGRGTGRRLLLDGLAWLVRQGATRAFVNTQSSNEAALGLYLDVGFREEPVGLSVLSAGLA
ncbi:MAG TPA: GNAT family N-acetyltransferase [Acidimicrobiales bacterium]|nr:GNAT family N-acetyltransferase [Acidimicrobiales bacterium]